MRRKNLIQLPSDFNKKEEKKKEELFPLPLKKSGKIATIALMVTLGMIFSYVEFLIPLNFGIPGIKLGLANVVVLVMLYSFGANYAISVGVLRVVLSGLLFTGIFSMIYGLSGGILSIISMIIIKKTNKFSIIGVSVLGSFFHIIGQLIVAALVFQNIKVFVYLPVLTIASVVTGILIGIISALILNKTAPFFRRNISFYQFKD